MNRLLYSSRVALPSIQRCYGRAITSANRLYSTSPESSKTLPITESQAQEKALKILDIFPGDSILKKTTFVTVGGSALAIAGANDLYVFTHDTMYATAFVILMRIFYLKLGPIVDKFATEGLQDVRNALIRFFSNERRAHEESIVTLSEQLAYKDYLQTYLEIEKENIELESKLSDILQINKNAASIKSSLDDRVRQVSQERETERKRILAELLDRVMADLKNPATQEAILKQCLSDIEGLGVRKLSL